MNDADRELLIELKTILVGKEGTALQGLAGALNKMERHLSKINDKVAEHTTEIEKNRDRISTQWKIGGGILGLVGLGLIALLLKVLELF